MKLSITSLYINMFCLFLLMQNAVFAQNNIIPTDSSGQSTLNVLNNLAANAKPDWSALPEPEVQLPAYLLQGIESDVVIQFPEGTDVPFNFKTELEVKVGDNLKLVEWNGQSLSIPVKTEEKCSIQLKSELITAAKEINPIPLWLSIIPPILAILLALIFKEVLSSLLTGIFSGVAIVGIYSDGFKGIFSAFFSIIDTHLLNALNNPDRLSVIVFTTVIGGVVALVSKNGGMMGVVNRIAKYANSAKNAQLTTWFLGIIIFFDDYANTLVVGNTMRPLTDRWKVSREKLSYLVDSTAAPVAAIAFVTTWIGAELGYIGDGLQQINQAGYTFDQSPYSVFLGSLQYSFYPIFTIIFMFFLIWSKKDFGPMLKAERRARTTGQVSAHNVEADQVSAEEMAAYEPDKGTKHKSIFAVVPISVVIFGTLAGLLITGYDSAVWNDDTIGFTRKLSTTIGDANSYKSLLWASLAAIFVAVFMTVGFRVMSLSKTMHAVINGFKFMMHAMLILILAWTLADITGMLHTADFLQIAVADDVSPWAIPAITFILAALVSFSTGSSWGTMAILYPLILPLTWSVSIDNGMLPADALVIFYNTVSCVLAGAVLGDHCSPISDTTILSSMSSSCNHIDHVKTQLPYALLVGTVAITIGTIPSALGLPGWLCMILGIVLLFFIVKYVGKPTEQAE